MSRVLTVALLLLAAAPRLALANGKPDGDMARLEGEWVGELTYEDWEHPGTLVTMPTRLFAALTEPATLACHYIFDDGPRQVHTYERIALDRKSGDVTWVGEDRKGKITSDARAGDEWNLVFEATTEPRERYTIVLGPRTLRLTKQDLHDDPTVTFKNEFTFERLGN